MRMVGLEPTRGHPRKILSLVRLPFRHIRSSALEPDVYLFLKPRFILSYPVVFCNTFFISEAVFFQSQSSQRLQNNLPGSLHGGSAVLYRPLSAVPLPTLIFHCNYIP